ncbi:hypothetical protein D623_10013631 [Myotis brandtii]|uniref:Uncharacterized protein n=1 Tax=Myotis brandtii TaxID=109478 RepID=S7N5B0_MYOBR|nr:hypothetical protein D623_10013631 [Myotis brandtii]
MDWTVDPARFPHLDTAMAQNWAISGYTGSSEQLLPQTETFTITSCREWTPARPGPQQTPGLLSTPGVQSLSLCRLPEQHSSQVGLGGR